MPIPRPTEESPSCKRPTRPRYAEHLTFLGAPETSPTQFIFFASFYSIMIWILVQHGDAIWERALKFCSNSPYHASFTLLLLDTIFFWVYGGILAVFELSNRKRTSSTNSDSIHPSSSIGVKIQPEKHLSLRHYWNIIKQGAFNQLFVAVPVGLFYSEWSTWMLLHLHPVTLKRCVFDFCAYIVVEEVLFYYLHRLLHHPKLYRYIHKQHHEYTAPIGLAAIYCHPFEHLLANLLPLFLGPAIMHSHPLMAFAWLFLATFNTVNSHSGWTFLHWPSPIMHDWHHYSFTENYGLMGWLDTFHATNKEYKRMIMNNKAKTMNITTK
jgi:fatty acid hydroxylase domain-containing protein 2